MTVRVVHVLLLGASQACNVLKSNRWEANLWRHQPHRMGNRWESIETCSMIVQRMKHDLLKSWWVRMPCPPQMYFLCAGVLRNTRSTVGLYWACHGATDACGVSRTPIPREAGTYRHDAGGRYLLACCRNQSFRSIAVCGRRTRRCTDPFSPMNRRT